MTPQTGCVATTHDDKQHQLPTKPLATADATDDRSDYLVSDAEQIVFHGKVKPLQEGAWEEDDEP